MQGDGSGPAPQEPQSQLQSQPRIAKCFEHGMQYDPTQQTGCVLCRRGAAPPKEPGTGGVRDLIERIPPNLRIWAAVAAGVVVVGVVIAILRATLSTATPVTATTINPDDSPEVALTKYVHAVHAAEKALPLEQAREALSGIGAEARAGTLDVRERRPKVEAYKTSLEQQRDAFAAIEAPAAASAYRSTMLEWYGSVIALVGVTLTHLRLHDDVQALVAKKQEITTREEAASLQDDFRAKQAEVASALENGRRLEADAKALSQRKSEEEARLIREHKLAMTPETAIPGRPAATSDDDKLANDPFCKSLLEQGGTIADCKAARR